MEAFCEARANKRRERDIHVCIKEIHTHMRETKMKKEEEELKQHEKSSQKAGGTIEDTRGTIEKVQKRNVLRHLLHAVGSTVSVVIPIYFMYHILIFMDFFSQIHCLHNKF
jgi:hypothetical protein